MSTLLTTKEVAEMIAVEPATVRRWARLKKLPSIRVGRRRRFLAGDIIDWLVANRTTQPAA